jgi:hypothetical protein
MFRRALSQDIVEKDPATGLGAYDRGGPRDRILTVEEIETVWKWLGSDALSLEASDIVKLQLLIGARCGEAARATIQYHIKNSSQYEVYCVVIDSLEDQRLPRRNSEGFRTIGQLLGQLTITRDKSLGRESFHAATPTRLNREPI